MYHTKSTIFCLIIVFVYLVTIKQCQSTPLDDYVNLTDPHLAWRVIETYKQPDYVLYILNFTSQQWFNGMFYINNEKDLHFSFNNRDLLDSIHLVALFMYYHSQ